jgi:hypothetical protein
MEMKILLLLVFGMAACAASAPVEVVVTVPAKTGVFAVYGVGGAATAPNRIVIPESGVAVVMADKVFDRWHTLRFEDRSGAVVHDARFVRSERDSNYSGIIHWFYRGSVSDQELYLDEGSLFWRRNWLRSKGLKPDK